MIAVTASGRARFAAQAYPDSANHSTLRKRRPVSLPETAWSHWRYPLSESARISGLNRKHHRLAFRSRHIAELTRMSVFFAVNSPSTARHHFELPAMRSGRSNWHAPRCPPASQDSGILGLPPHTRSFGLPSVDAKVEGGNPSIGCTAPLEWGSATDDHTRFSLNSRPSPPAQCRRAVSRWAVCLSIRPVVSIAIPRRRRRWVGFGA